MLDTRGGSSFPALFWHILAQGYKVPILCICDSWAQEKKPPVLTTQACNTLRSHLGTARHPCTPISTCIPDKGTQQVAAKPAAKERDDFMHQTGEIFPVPANMVLSLQPGCQETETQLQKVLCHPSLQ